MELLVALSQVTLPIIVLGYVETMISETYESGPVGEFQQKYYYRH